MSSTEHPRPMGLILANNMNWIPIYSHYAASTSRAYQHLPSSHPKGFLPSIHMDRHPLRRLRAMGTWPCNDDDRG
jgi:hypothetical protein